MNMKTDYKWLEVWASRIADKSVLELGAGEGMDTTFLRMLSSSLVSTDLNTNEELGITYLDHSKPLPFEENSFDVVVSSLSMHYFYWNKTIEIIKEISRILKKGGLLVCRVNSVNDTNYGATGYPEVETGLYQVKGQIKRFFKEEDILKLFAKGWNIVSIEEKQIDRYKNLKSVWEFGAVSELPDSQLPSFAC